MKDSKVIYTEEGQEVIPKTTPKRPSKPSGQKKISSENNSKKRHITVPSTPPSTPVT